MMREAAELTGVVLYAQPVGEYDRRLVILTRERGKITAFARGARRPKSPYIAVTNPFVFARFSLYEGRDSYTLAHAEAADYMTELASKMPGVLYGYYFLELASYFGREGLEAGESVNLLYAALRALIRGQMSPELVRRVYELRSLMINGEYALPESGAGMDGSAWYAVRHTVASPVSKLFSFTLSEEAERSYTAEVSSAFRRTVDKTFKSLAVIDKMR